MEKYFWQKIKITLNIKRTSNIISNLFIRAKSQSVNITNKRKRFFQQAKKKQKDTTSFSLRPSNSPFSHSSALLERNIKREILSHQSRKKRIDLKKFGEYKSRKGYGLDSNQAYIKEHYGKIHKKNPGLKKQKSMNNKLSSSMNISRRGNNGKLPKLNFRAERKGEFLNKDLMRKQRDAIELRLKRLREYRKQISEINT